MQKKLMVSIGSYYDWRIDKKVYLVEVGKINTGYLAETGEMQSTDNYNFREPTQEELNTYFKELDSMF